MVGCEVLLLPIYMSSVRSGRCARNFTFGHQYDEDEARLGKAIVARGALDAAMLVVSVGSVHV